jgi:hypothetical protein
MFGFEYAHINEIYFFDGFLRKNGILIQASFDCQTGQLVKTGLKIFFLLE